MKYTICVVAHETDYKALIFQARSFAKYLSPGLVQQILIIENPTILNQNYLKDQYGKLRDLVHIIPGEAIAPPEAFSWTGWWSQQILKLMVAEIVNTDRYLCLDAKNTLVFPLKRGFLERKGRPISFLVDYTKHSSLRWLKHSLDYFQLPEHHIKAFFPTVTPFVMTKKLVLEMIDYVEERERTSLAIAFLKHQLTEFFLYAAYLTETAQLNYDLSGHECKTIWDVLHKDDYVNDCILETEVYRLPFFSVHRRAIPKLSVDASRKILEFYARRGLVACADERT